MVFLGRYLFQEAGDDLRWGEFARLVTGGVIGSAVVPIRSFLILGATTIGGILIWLAARVIIQELDHSWVVSWLVVIEFPDLPQVAEAGVTPQEGPNQIQLRSTGGIRLEG